ncbi:uncharacterized protein [Ptychodera flava]|uniref:uncharacterized protein n=1 Tax=Ptychodera flava TaxID=63121 RepID=UPI00396A1B5E
MNPKQREILNKNFRLLSTSIQLKDVLGYIKRMHPDVFQEGEIRNINSKSRQAGLDVVFEKLKLRSDGYRLLFLALQNTNHNDKILNTLRPGLGLKSVRTPQGSMDECSKKDAASGSADVENVDQQGDAASGSADVENVDQQGEQMGLVLRHLQGLSSKMDDNRDEILTELGAVKSQFRSFTEEHRREICDLQKKLQSLEEAILSNAKTQDNLKKDLKILIDDVVKFKKEFETFQDKMTKEEKERGSRHYEIVNKILEKLSSLDPTDKDKMWQEIEKLRQDVEILKESHETLSVSIRSPRVSDTPSATATYLSTPRSRNDTVKERDIRPLAKKVKLIWSPLSKHMRVDITKTKSGEGVMDDEGKAEAVLMKWLDNSKDTGRGYRTWGELHSLISKIDKDLADDIVYLHKDNH